MGQAKRFEAELLPLEYFIHEFSIVLVDALPIILRVVPGKITVDALPFISEAFREGRLAWSKARTMTRMAGPDKN